MASPHVAGNLPAELSSFVGRRQELLDVRRLLGESRLVTVTGPGGIGKSRLALRTAAETQRSFPDGAWLVELAAVTDASLLADAIVSHLRVPGPSGRDPLESLVAFLSERSMLVVLDNCEQLRDACASLVATLLAQAHGLRVLATSREVLGLPGETVYRLQPLPVPEQGASSAGGVAAYAAVSLFAHRAAAAMNGFEVTEANAATVVELCRRLDGVPLAIELAAAHARALSPAQILERLDDRFRLLAARAAIVHPRHRSLRAAVEWSYDLCSKPERLVWNRFSVFSGSVALAAAQAVCASEGLTELDVIEVVEDLVYKSVLVSEPHAGEMRYRMLETIREFGLQQLRANAEQGSENALSEAVLRRRHLDWYAELADDFDQHWFGHGQSEWLERLRADLPDIRTALAFAADNPQHARAGVRLAGSLGFFWRVTGMREGQTWLTRLLSADTAPTRERAQALSALAWFMAARGERADGVDIASEALAIANRVDPQLSPRVMLLLGTLIRLDDHTAGMDLLEQAVTLARELASEAEIAYTVFGLGWALGLAGDSVAAAPHFREAIAICESAGEHWWCGVVNLRWALVAWLQDDHETMAEAATDSLRAARLVPDPLTCADAVNILAGLEVGRHDRRAAYLLGAGDRHWRDAGGSIVHSPPWDALLAERRARCRERLGPAAFDQDYQRGNTGSLRDAIARALGEHPDPAPSKQETRADFGLTRRELEIVALLAEGLTNKEIAKQLVISPRTAETHVDHILGKTGFRTRSQVAGWYAALRDP
jgi:predicted ATPase/DNA-binding CsgD family transcriptional regulator